MTGNNMDNFTDDASPKAGVPTCEAVVEPTQDALGDQKRAYDETFSAFDAVKREFLTATPTEMELRVAKVLNPAAWGLQDASRLPSFYQGLRNDALTKARAAIHAMREPTFPLLNHGIRALSLSLDVHRAMLNAWQAMIDAASPPEVK